MDRIIPGYGRFESEHTEAVERKHDLDEKHAGENTPTRALGKPASVLPHGVGRPAEEPTPSARP